MNLTHNRLINATYIIIIQVERSKIIVVVENCRCNNLMSIGWIPQNTAGIIKNIFEGIFNMFTLFLFI